MGLLSPAIESARHMEPAVALDGHPASGLQWHSDIRGYVFSAEARHRMRQVSRTPLVEIRAGAGWGKTALLVQAAREAAVAGAHVAVIRSSTNDIDVLAPRSKPTLFVIDDEDLTDELIGAVLDRVATRSMGRVLLASRGNHCVAERARERGIITATVGVAHLRFVAQDLVSLAQMHGAEMTPHAAAHVVDATQGWPLVLAEFVRSLEPLQARGITMSSALLDELIVTASRRSLNHLLGSVRVGDLAVAALPDRVSPTAMDDIPSASIDAVLGALESLGLGDWE